ncbi:NF-X1-type zinc finger protein NFXL1 [Tanacetum coccineum]
MEMIDDSLKIIVAKNGFLEDQHLKWARAPTSIDLSAQKNQGFNWRCPGCQSVQLTSDDGRCHHRCVVQCHPGPCPPCKAFAPPRICPCGKKTIPTRCSDQKSLLTCGQRCGKPLKCLRHCCSKTCHVGPCDSCDVQIDASCFCKKKIEVVVCGDMAVKGHANVENDGIFSCNSSCGKPLGCGNHVCKETCHPGVCGDCELLPGRITSCHCGKSSLQEERHSCLDPIPTCSKICDKILPCGLHRCKDKCHPGSCAPCRVMVTQKCRCGSTYRTVECFNTTTTMTDGADTAFKCDKPCGRKKNCGRHRCSDKCCPLSNSKNSAATQGWDPHLCSKPCEKKLRCGQHDCETLCHSGHCPPCQETIFTDLTCACGRSSIPPPLPCGTPPPSCQYPCSVPQPCGHPSSHSCHFGDCPPCSVPIPKECIGGHVVLRNIPCGSKDIRCNKLCGLHHCKDKCHPKSCAPCRVMVTQKCHCGSTYRTMECFNTTTTMTDGADTTFKCDKPCGRKKNCGRHRCSDKCCPLSNSKNSATTQGWDPYLCSKPCEKKLRCGQHDCETLCHSGHCPPCQETIFTDLTCAYGRSSIHPPLPCGTLPPSCQYPCSVPQPCGHPSSHSYHFGDCPPLWDAYMFKNVPSVLFSFLSFYCRHFDVLYYLGHMFRPLDFFYVIHVDLRIGSRCLIPAFHLVLLGCYMDNVLEASAVQKLPVPLQPVEVNGKKIPLGQRKLTCDDECSKVEHKKVLADAFEVDTNLEALHFGESSAVSDMLGDLFRRDPRWVLSVEERCKMLVLGRGRSGGTIKGCSIDPARAATAMRRLDHGSVYHGAAVLSTNGTSSTGVSSNVWGGGASTTNPWKKAVVQQDHSDSWIVAQEWVNPETSPWKVKEGPLITTSSANRWSILESEVGSSQESGKVLASNVLFENEPSSSSTSSSNAAAALKQDDVVVEDWEKAYD